ncbi:MAG: PliI family lysozyme inhibitor of I-type lysozyme [Lachnospiraceae bacterium]|nr:PliI family lysozyme inhibitor of I-type lysozyme [Lachnospiraceae bacterium]
MKRKSKVAAIMVCSALVLSGMYGCGKTDGSVTPEQSTQAEETDEGKGDLITDEEQSAEAVEEMPVNELAIQGPSYTGLSNLSAKNNEDGSYFYEDMTEDSLTVITNMCSANSQRDGQDPDAYAENFVCALVDQTGTVKITDSKSDETVSAALTYPSYRVYWETGSNEDTRQMVGVVVLTDSFTYYYGYGCPADYYDENAGFYESELDSIKLIDLKEMNAGAADAGDGAAGGSDKPYGAPYIDKMNELKSEGLADQFALADIDGDDVPELIASDSTGSFNHENAFIFTFSNGEVNQLAAVITGVDGGNLDYAEGADLIHVSGSVAGMREVFMQIKDGKTEEVFTAEATGMDEDAKYSVNGSSVKEEEYYEQINGFVKSYDPLTRIAYDGLYEVSYKYENGYGGFEQGGSKKYSTAEEISKEL